MPVDPQPPVAAAPAAPAPAGADRAAGARDPDAFETVYREHVGRVHALCLRMTGDAREAEELTQDVFVRAWERLPSFRGESALGTWLHRLAVNVVLETARGTRRRERRVEPTSDLAALAPAMGAAGAAPDERIALDMDLERAIAGLPRAVRTVFVLHDIEGYRHDEIARLTGGAVGTMRSQLHRARRLLMEALGR
jgi:RNA polymerase sigma-70 factor, ECF subfamily